MSLSPRILLALETCDFPKYLPRRRMIEETWWKRKPPGYDFEVFTGARLGVPDDYKSLCLKTKAICEYAREHSYDWLAKCDDDVYVRTELLEPPEGHDYEGYHMAGDSADGKGGEYSAGCFYWLSARAIDLVATAPLELDVTRAEDLWVGRIMRRHGIKLHQGPIAHQPCVCGRCLPVVDPDDWTAYIMGMKWDPKLFMAFEEKYGEGQNPRGK